MTAPLDSGHRRLTKTGGDGETVRLRVKGSRHVSRPVKGERRVPLDPSYFSVRPSP